MGYMANFSICGKIAQEYHQVGIKSWRARAERRTSAATGKAVWGYIRRDGRAMNDARSVISIWRAPDARTDIG